MSSHSYAVAAGVAACVAMSLATAAPGAASAASASPTPTVGEALSLSHAPASIAAARDRGAPRLPLHAPSSGATLRAPVTITARPTDPSGIRDVRFLVDGALVSTDSAAPYAWRLDPARVGAGPLVLTVTATDRAGNSRSYGRRYVSAPASAPVVAPRPTAPSPKPEPVAEVPTPPAPAPAPPPSTGGDDSDLRFDVQQAWANVTGPGPITREEHAPFPGHQVARDDSLVAVTDIRQGIAPYAARFTVRDGDQPGSTSGERAEIYTGGNGSGTEAEGTSGYYSMAVYFPADFTSTTWTIFHQMHGSVSGSSPALSLYVEKNRLQAIRRGGSASSPITSSWVIEPTLTRGRWHQFVYYARWSRGQDGVLKVWHRVPGLSGSWRLAVDSTGPMGFASSSGFVKPYPKFGIYRSSAESGTTVLYHGGFRLRAKSFAGAAGIFG
jgi:hypothetical protein